MRPMLRPGLHVVRRDVRTLQLGLEWPGVVALADTPAVREVLAAVDGFRDLEGVMLAVQARGLSEEDTRRAVDALLDCGVLVDQGDVRPANVEAPVWCAWWLLSGP